MSVYVSVSLPACVYVCLSFSCLLVLFCVFSDGSRLSVCLFLSVCVRRCVCALLLLARLSACLSMCLSTCLFVHRPSHVHLSMHLVCLSIRVQILAPKYYQYLKKKLDTVSFLMVQSVFPLWLMIRRTSPLTNYLSDYGLAVNHVPVRG